MHRCADISRQQTFFRNTVYLLQKNNKLLIHLEKNVKQRIITHNKMLSYNAVWQLKPN